MAVASMWTCQFRNLMRISRPGTINSYLSSRGTNRSLTNATENKPDGERNKDESSETEEKVAVIDPEVHKKLKDEGEKLTAELKEMKDKYMRSLAETENVRTRLRKEISNAKEFGIQGFCKDLIDVADILGQAVESTPKEEINDSNPHLKTLFEGLTLTNAQMLKVFEKHGLSQISPKEGEKFDPFLHEALFEVPTAASETGSIAVMQKVGYKLHNRTVRPALVGVFKST